MPPQTVKYIVGSGGNQADFRLIGQYNNQYAYQQQGTDSTGKNVDVGNLLLVHSGFGSDPTQNVSSFVDKSNFFDQSIRNAVTPVTGPLGATNLATDTPSTAAPMASAAPIAPSSNSPTLPSYSGLTPPGTAPATSTASSALDTNYQVKPGESIADYTKRIQQYNASKGDVSSRPELTSFQSTPISSASMTSSGSKPTYSQPTPYTPYNTSGLDSNVPQNPIQLTAAEQQAQDMNQRLQALNTQESGKAAYQTSQNDAAGVNTYTNTLTDLSSRLDSLKAEAAAIPQQIQQDSSGRAITGGGLQPIQTAALRNNAIQSLTISAQIDATKGLLTSAQAKADRAVAEIYGPIEAQITAAKDNLTLIMNSPEASVEDKNRAQAQLDIQNAKAQALDKQKTDTANILKIANDAAANGADASTLDRISKAASPTDALSIAAAGGFTTKPTDSWSAPYMLGGDYVQKNAQTGEIRTAVNVPAQKSPSNSNSAPASKGKLSNKQFVELSLERANLAYNDVVNKIPKGKVGVVDNATGQIGYINSTEYNTKQYTLI